MKYNYTIVRADFKQAFTTILMGIMWGISGALVFCFFASIHMAGYDFYGLFKR